MQEIKKRRIVIASVLKPADDPRMFEKIGQSLSTKYEVHCIGSASKTVSNPDSIQLHLLPPFQRLSLYRLVAPIQIFRKILSLKPALVIFCTHELLFIAVAAKFLVGCRIVYDLQENYWRNIFYGKSFLVFFRPFLAAYVRLKERIASPFVDYYFLAEKAYAEEMTFVKGKNVVLENKTKRSSLPKPPKKSVEDGNTHLLFGGTLAETTGVFEAITISKKLYEGNRKIKITIAGYSHVSATVARIKNEIRDYPFIELIGGDTFVSHNLIISLIQSSDFGIIAYPPNPSTSNSIPTKLYEYLGYQLPILLINHEPWVKICQPYPAAIPFDPVNFDTLAVQEAMNQQFYQTSPVDVFWDSEESKLLQTIENLLK